MISVLFVHNAPVILEISKIFLERTGEFEVDTTRLAIDALEQLKARAYDAVVSDYDMPVMNGIEFLKTVRSNDPDIPFIMFSGLGEVDIAADALKNGADFYIGKGGSPKIMYMDLMEKIKTALKQREKEGRGEWLQNSVNHQALTKQG